MSTDNLILYTDGSFKDRKAGWGIHGYFYQDVPMTSKANLKQQPTKDGYQDVDKELTCTVSNYVDGFGTLEGKQTNNTAELVAVIKAIEFAIDKKVKTIKVFLDSDYVRVGLLKHLNTWVKKNWKNSKGQDVQNKDLWLTLDRVYKELQTTATVELIKVKGHSGDLGNDKADLNALRGTQTEKKVIVLTEAVEINKVKKININPLILESRLLFSTIGDTSTHYYTYNLGKSHNYGVRPRDNAKQKIEKADLLLGRRLSEATYSVFKAKEAEDYLDELKNIHIRTLGSKEPELAIINLVNACNARQRQQIESLRENGLLIHEDIKAISTPEMALISRTLNPPRLAFDALNIFNNLERTLDEYLNNKLGKDVRVIDITEMLFTDGKKKDTKQLLKTITNATPYLELEVDIENKPHKTRLLLGVDIPARNQLNRIANEITKVSLLVYNTGPFSYGYSVLFESITGDAIYNSPYVQFLTK